jgi:hypothetical protein
MKSINHHVATLSVSFSICKSKNEKARKTFGENISDGDVLI